MDERKPVALIILDGWGIREMAHGNAVVQAQTPNTDRWLRTYERSILEASGEAVGLPDGQMGNSEVGHLNLGAGRIVYQDLARINKSIRDNEFGQVEALQTAVMRAKAKEGKVHLIGLLGSGGVHSHSRHLYALLDLCHEQGVTPIIHVITDGRDTPPRSGLSFLQELEAYLEDRPGIIASVSGRYYTMDRDKRWLRTQAGYELMVYHQGMAHQEMGQEGQEGRTAVSAQSAIQQAYDNDVTDEFIKPVAIETDQDVRVANGDSLIFYNFRADRMRQIVSALSLPDFIEFERRSFDDLHIVTMTNYANHLPVKVAFPDISMAHTLPQVIEDNGLKQFHAAETEKYAHVTYFFNGGVEQQYPGEERLMVPSPQVATYDLQPEMSAPELAAKTAERIAAGVDDFILVNFANPDMVGHSGNLEAAIKAVETVDACAAQLVEAVLAREGVALVTADHGNAERMIDEKTGTPHTYHTTQPVSFIAIGREYIGLRPSGILADVAPTILDLLQLPQPAEMTGQSLIE
ncbi:MAG: 2,3-bisphosphoglycerate-independent phosphoglycerate mutase [Chloroflexota bacterium]